MPKVVDHDLRRRQIADGVARVARSKGLVGVSFREVAAAAGVSVSLVQHYFGSKANLLVGTLEIQSAGFAELIGARLSVLGPDAGPRERLWTIAASFIPSDPETTAAMTLYHAFAGAALADPDLRGAESFRNAEALREGLGRELALAQESGAYRSDFDPATEATAILSLVLGLSLAVLLEQSTSDEANAVLDSHLARLRDGATQVPR